MKEQPNDKVNIVKRSDELFDILDNHCEACWNGQTEQQLPRNITALQQYIGRLVENAYLAGLHRLTCNHEPDVHQSVGFGSNLVLARNYAKDKGLIL